LVGAKGLVEAARAAEKLKVKLKIVGESVGFSMVRKELIKVKNVELLGRVSNIERNLLYAKSKGFIALAKDEDFGVTPVEAMAAGTPVIAFDGGGFRETVVDGKTGILIKEVSAESLERAIRRFDSIKWQRKQLIDQARKFSRKVFEIKMKDYIRKVMKEDA